MVELFAAVPGGGRKEWDGEGGEGVLWPGDRRGEGGEREGRKMEETL